MVWSWTSLHCVTQTLASAQLWFILEFTVHMRIIGPKWPRPLPLSLSPSLPAVQPFPGICKRLGEHERANILPAAFLKPNGTQCPPADGCSCNSADNDESQSASVSTIHQYLQCCHVVDDDGPADSRCSRRQIVLPYYEQNGKKLRARADYQGGGE
jgi:hypothetical protein